MNNAYRLQMQYLMKHLTTFGIITVSDTCYKILISAFINSYQTVDLFLSPTSNEKFLKRKCIEFPLAASI